MNAKQNTALILIVCASVLSACAAPKTRYGDAQAVETVKNTFGSTDLQMMAESMTRSMLASAVIQKADRPVITLSGVRNKTNEYIDTNAITNSIRAQMLKSGSVRFAVDRKDMDNQVAELERQADPTLYDPEQIKVMGGMVGADFRIEGDLESIVKEAKRVKDVYYKFSLRLIDVETGLIEWADEKEIRKTTSR